MTSLILLPGSGGTFAGIGSRKIIASLSRLKMEFGCCMAFAGLVVNSGAADGSDTAYETGAQIAYDAMCQLEAQLEAGAYGKVMNVFLPWRGFNYRQGGRREGYIVKASPLAEQITAPFHPNWANLRQGPRKMMSRNAMQTLNESLDLPVRFVMCYTPDGAIGKAETSSKTGGTGQAIRIAEHYQVPVYNLGRPEHVAKAQQWIEQYSEKVLREYGVDPRILVDEYLASHKGIEKTREGDLVELAKQGEIDVLVHGCNCQNTRGSGLAQQVFTEFPEAFQADQATRKGDKKKLGTYTAATVERNGRPVTIVNAYTQYRWGRDEHTLYADYEAVRKVMKQIKTDFGHQRIGLPRIGAGLANGCWVTLSNIIDGELTGTDHCLVDLPDGYVPQFQRTPEPASQLGLI